MQTRAISTIEIIIATAVAILVIAVVVLGVLFLRLQQQRVEAETKQAAAETSRARAQAQAANAQAAIANHVLKTLTGPEIVLQDMKNLKALAVSMEEYSVDKCLDKEVSKHLTPSEAANDQCAIYPKSLQELSSANGGIYWPGSKYDLNDGHMPHTVVIRGPMLVDPANGKSYTLKLTGRGEEGFVIEDAGGLELDQEDISNLSAVTGYPGATLIYDGHTGIHRTQN
jgi:uncharacterized membrane-anchored protein YhcB (DUF1043 family)